jgi:hypothetical protein
MLYYNLVLQWNPEMIRVNTASSVFHKMSNSVFIVKLDITNVSRHLEYFFIPLEV